MGEVYRATDSRLGRDVALKLLPEKFARDTERMARFKREAKVLASLNHPNIASIYGLEESNGARVLVMELVEGVTLADRIKGGPLALDEALPIAKQIAEGFEYAHEHGIIHRDLKPSNVKVRPDGQVKILDFGLAKAFEGETTEEEIENSPTLSAVATRVGVLLGTAAYMSPEQARGKRVDRRADIWAFGCVLYEMLTGREAFRGETTSDILASVIRAEPDWSSIPTSVPPRIRDLLRRCLQKDPKQRLRDIGDARIAVEEVLSGAPQETAGAQSAYLGLPVWRRAVPWAAGILLAALASAAVWELRPRGPVGQIVHFSFTPPAGHSLVAQPSGSTGLAISPDGTSIAFVVEPFGTSQLYLRRMDQSEATLLKGTEGGDAPFFSPDGQWVGFFADGKLKKISVLGGTPVTLCDAPIGRGGTWTPDDIIIFAHGTGSGLMRVSATGGTPQPFTRLDSTKDEITHRWPQVLPGAKAVVYAIGIEFNSATIAVASLKSGAAKTLAIQGGYPRYITEGYLVFERQEGLYAVAFDLERLEVTGSPFLVLQVQAAPQAGVAGYAVSETGSLVYIPPVETIAKLAWVSRQGVLVPLQAPGRDYLVLRLSPDGKRVLMVIREKGFADIWIYDIQRGTLTRLTFGAGDNFSPVFSPDGQRIAFLRLKDANFSILTKPADGSGSEETLLPPQSVRSTPFSWSPDGKFLAYVRRSTGLGEIWVLPLEGERKPQIVLANQFDNLTPIFSPDGRFLAYLSDENGRDEVYVMPFRNGSAKWQISTNGASAPPVWQRDGKQLFYPESGNIMGVDIATQPTFHASTPKVIVPAKTMGNFPSGPFGFNISPDGQRFLIRQQGAQTAQINVILNWTEELRRRSSSGKN